MHFCLNNSCKNYLGILTFLLIFGQLQLVAQSTNQAPKGAEVTSFKFFYEKVYLHLDRTTYATGEDIWFNAYLVNGQSNYLTSTSNTLYVELISPSSKIAERKTIRLDNGTGRGDFKLSDTIPSGKYRIRAYTNWIKNFKDLFVFEKEIQIFNAGKEAVTGPLFDHSKYNVGFFPESGSLISETNSLIGFKAVDAYGKGVDVSGKIISSEGDTVSSFQSTHLGMGKFNLFAVHGQKYFATGLIKNKYPFKTELPGVVPEGLYMTVNNGDTGVIKITVLTNHQTLTQLNNNKLILLGQQYGKACFKAEVTLSGTQSYFSVPKSYFANGIASITLFDQNLKPSCERIIFIENNKKVNISLTSDKSSYRPREAVTLKVKTSDVYGNPVKTHLSLSVIDGMLPSDPSNIVSYLMLQAEVKGTIEEPANYFDPKNADRYKQLDLLLMVQGWRNFLWKQLKDSVIRLKFMMEPGINYSGLVRQKLVNKPIPNAEISAFVSGNAKQRIFLTKTDSTGKFYLDGLEFYGKTKVSISSMNKKGKGTGWIIMDTTGRAPLQVPFKPTYFDDNFNKVELESRKNVMKKYTLSDTIELSEVIIAAKNERAEKQQNMHMMEAGLIDYEFKIGPDDYSHVNIGSFLLSKIPGATQPTEVAPGDDPTKVVFRSFGQETTPRFLLDNHRIEVEEDFIVYNLPMEDIDKIYVSKKDISNPSAVNSYVISVYTKPNAGKKDFFRVSLFENGYYQAREFYSPVYNTPLAEGGKPDVRNTLYWNPGIETDDKGEAVIRFFNADKQTTINAQIEGVTSKGIPVTAKTSYTVK